MGKKHKNKPLNAETITANKDHKVQVVNSSNSHVEKFVKENEVKKKKNRQLKQKSCSVDDVGNTINVNKVETKIDDLVSKKAKKRKHHTSEVPPSEQTKEITIEESGSGLYRSGSEDCFNTEEKKEKRDKNKVKTKKEKKSKLTMTEGLPNEQSKKPEGDNLKEIPATTEPANTKLKKNYLNEFEAAVKDEDIDEFCDEIDEEDNRQYENWIQLLEAKLHPNKKNE